VQIENSDFPFQDFCQPEGDSSQVMLLMNIITLYYLDKLNVTPHESHNHNKRVALTEKIKFSLRMD
jgi:hypothetical protein